MFKFIFIGFLLINNCKPTNRRSVFDLSENCFYYENGYTILNFYNKKDEEIEIPNISPMINSDFIMMENYYNLKNDTLYIRLPDENDIQISHTTPETKIKVHNPTITVNNNQNRQQIFKLERDFNVIVIDSNIKLRICENE